MIEIEKPAVIYSDETVREAIKLMKNLNVKNLIVVKNNKFFGIIRERDLLIEKNLNTKLEKVKRIFAYCETDDVREIAKKMYEADSYLVAYVNAKGEVIGQVYIDSLLEYIKKNFGEIRASEIMSKPVISVEKDVPISKVLKIMYENNISHIPITENSKLIAIVSARDIILNLKEKERETIGELKGEKLKFLSNPIISIASKPVITFEENDKIRYLIDKMFKYNISCLVEKNLKGIITKKDFLKVLLEKGREKILIRVSASELTSYQQDELKKYLRIFERKVSKDIKGELIVIIRKEQKFYRFNLKFSSNKKSFFVNLESEKFLDGLQEAFDKLIRQIREEEDKKLTLRKRAVYEYLKQI